MQNNLIYFEGPHGSGKTTLMEKLVEENPRVIVPELVAKNVKFHTEAGYRQVLKICSRAIENYEYLEFAQANPEKIVIGNRCIYGVLAYNWVYYNRGWISGKTFEKYNRHVYDFFKNENSAPWTVILNPGFEVVKSHLQKRWTEKGQKWNEDDLAYTELACKSYEFFRGKENVLYIDHEVNLETKTETGEISEWLRNIYYGERARELVSC